MATLPRPGSIGIKAWSAVTSGHVFAYRLSRGRFLGRWKNRHPATFSGVPVLLLDHVGRRSAKRRTNPLVYMPDGDDLVIVASRGGSPSNPGWFHNLEAKPSTSVQVGAKGREVVARRASAKEKRALWPRLAAHNPEWDDYERQTQRDIPVVILSPAD